MDELQELSDQIKVLAKRRDELLDQRSGVDSDLQNLRTNLANAILEVGDPKKIEAFKRDRVNTEDVLQAINIAVAEAEKRISLLSSKVIALHRSNAEVEFCQLGDEIAVGIMDALQHLFSIGDEIASLTITYRRMKEIGAPYGIVAGVFLDPKKADTIDAFKLLLGWNFEHRLEVVQRRYPSLDAEIRENMK
jgi:hypothetical protein